MPKKFDTNVLSTDRKDSMTLDFANLTGPDDPNDTRWRGLRFSFAFRVVEGKKMEQADFDLLTNAERVIADFTSVIAENLTSRGIIEDGSLSQLEAGPISPEAAAVLTERHAKAMRDNDNPLSGLIDALRAAGLDVPAGLENSMDENQLSDEAEAAGEVTGLRIS